MALPGLSLPGLSLSASTPDPSSTNGPQSTNLPAPSSLPPRTEELPPRSELRFEVGLTRTYSIRLLRGTAELFGTELAPSATHTFSGGTKGAVFTWHGCALEIQGEAESEYVGSETDAMVEWLNVHGMLETARNEASASATPETSNGGPRVLVVGPDHSGKSSLVKCLTAWALKSGRTPTVVNLDPREGLLSIPSALTAVTMSSMMDIEDSSGGGGWGTSPISGPTYNPVKTPLIYHYPFASPEVASTNMFKPIVTRAALAVTSRLEEDRAAKDSGIIIDTPGSINNPKTNYDTLAHIISEFSISILLTMGSERLYNDMVRRFATQQQQQQQTTAKSPDEIVHVFRISTTGGAVTRDAAFMRQLSHQQVKSYFFGDSSKLPLNPHGQWWDFADLSIYKAIDPSSASQSASSNANNNQNLNLAPGMDEDEIEAQSLQASSMFLQRLDSASQALLNSILAIKFCPGNASVESVRDSCVMGFVYVAEVDETRKRIRFLAPHPSRWGDRALVWGSEWPESVGDLVA
ncbi:hypothetical protein AAFC00_000431 [Neodothiora populina]|uniref:Polynucleotide 5'-hydroxyl-kinase GRC3 n=1 Tax=Neodothiora populina TaxID=2781224 RepID=A0ABR3PCV2_9PEZI